MTATFIVTVQLDAAEVERQAARAGLALETAHTAIVDDIENRIDSAIKWRDGVARVAVSPLGGASRLVT